VDSGGGESVCARREILETEPPLPAEAGQYAELTQGELGDRPDFPVGFWL
jgi:hypothetical protein